MKDALEANDLAGIQASLDPLVQFQNRMIGHQAEVGSRQERIEVCKNILSDLNLNYSNQLSDTEGIDMTQAITLLQVKQTVYECCPLVCRPDFESKLH